MKLTADAMVSARLRLVRPLGRGGMGSVWVAYHQSLKTEVAVKFLDGGAQQSPNALARFEREAEIAASLKSPHVAHTYDHGVFDDGTPYIVMELLEGESLQARLRRGPLSLHETALVVGQTAQALGKAHKMGIIHRDVKPGNLFLLETDYDLFVKLLDFGIAKHLSLLSEAELTKTGNLLGSPAYMSPEQFTKVKSVDWRADLWSLAVVAYRCLTNTAPFEGEAIGNVIMAVMQRDYMPVCKVLPKLALPPAFDDWFATAFHQNVDNRHQTAKELATSFVEIVQSASPPNKPRVPLPSITDMTQAPEAVVRGLAMADVTHQLRRSWQNSTPAPSLNQPNAAQQQPPATPTAASHPVAPNTLTPQRPASQYADGPSHHEQKRGEQAPARPSATAAQRPTQRGFQTPHSRNEQLSATSAAAASAREALRSTVPHTPIQNASSANSAAQPPLTHAPAYHHSHVRQSTLPLASAQQAGRNQDQQVIETELPAIAHGYPNGKAIDSANLHTHESHFESPADAATLAPSTRPLGATTAQTQRRRLQIAGAALSLLLVLGVGGYAAFRNAGTPHSESSPEATPAGSSVPRQHQPAEERDGSSDGDGSEDATERPRSAEAKPGANDDVGERHGDDGSPAASPSSSAAEAPTATKPPRTVPGPLPRRDSHEPTHPALPRTSPTNKSTTKKPEPLPLGM